MTCQRCRDEASVHLTESIDGTLRELHLCARCARKAGLPVSQPPPGLALDAAIQSLIVKHVGELVGELADRACPVCGIRYMEFRGEGRLGCPNDYEVFRAGLVPLLKKAQGASRHVGKFPGRRPTDSSRLSLRAQLRAAVAREDYEQAASLRDMLR